MGRAVIHRIMAATMDGSAGQTRIGLADCDHRNLAYLGAGGTVSYYRCRLCGKAVIEERRRRWVIRGIGEEAR
jgi:hypothetical protein